VIAYRHSKKVTRNKKGKWDEDPKRGRTIREKKYLLRRVDLVVRHLGT